MSIYSDISKKIGWQRQVRKPVSFMEAEQLAREVENGSAEAFEKVFTLWRFMDQVDLTEDQMAAFMQIEVAFQRGKEIFS